MSDSTPHDTSTLRSFFNVVQTRKARHPPPVSPCSRAHRSGTSAPATADATTVYVYTDGSCVHNGKPYARAGIGVYFGPHDSRNVSEPIDGKQTNNTAEIKAILRACGRIAPELLVEKRQRFVIVTDSEYAMRCATTYGDKQAAKGWTADIPNKALVRQLHGTLADEPRITLQKVAAHTGRSDRHSVGNSHADQLAYDSIGMGEKGLGLPDVSRRKSDINNITPPISKYSDRKSACMGKSRTYLKVSYNQKDVAKSCGARWDPEQSKWYITRSHAQHDSLVRKYGKAVLKSTEG